jgi:hypothetical protein
MKNIAVVTRVLACGFLLVSSGALALLPSDSHSVRLQSPDKRFTISLSETSEQGVYRLIVLDQGRQLSHYRFEGELVTAYWSPSQNYVAVNNHNGHRGWYPWVISLRTGAVVRASGEIRSAEYDRYLDYEYEPDLRKLAREELERIYPEFSDDTMREGYISIAYGWSSGDQLLMFHEFGLDNLFVRDDSVIWVTSSFLISNQGMTVRDISAHKVAGEWWKKYPPEVAKTLNLQTSPN